MLPSREWKRTRFAGEKYREEHRKWYLGDSISAGIGQGYNAFTPMQLAHAIAIVANDGVAFRPHLVKNIVNLQDRRGARGRADSPRTRITREARAHRVHQERARRREQGRHQRRGVRRRRRSRRGGKTGTAQVYSLKGEKYVAHKIDERLRDHAWFMAYAPADKPRIALAVLVENGGFGAQAAAPIARKVLEYYLLGKTEPGAGDRRAGRAKARTRVTDAMPWTELARPRVGSARRAASTTSCSAARSRSSAWASSRCSRRPTRASARVTTQVASLGFALVLDVDRREHPAADARARRGAAVRGRRALLVGVALFGVVVNGSRRWLNLGVVRIQPSELMKIALPLMLAWYFQKFEGRIRWKDFVIAAVLIVVPVYLIKRQPDLGTSLLIAASGFYVLFLAGLSWKVIVGLAVAGAAPPAPFLWSHLHDYQRERILTFIDPSRDPLGAGYHSTQASIAIGSGGVIGKGWLNGTQTHLDFLPERHTDFIFAVFGEEFGLIGNGVLLVLYMLLIGRAMVITANASTLFARLLAGAVTLMFFTYVFVNMGMVSGILPVVGVPLPLVSYGGTALVSLFIGLGILMSVQAHRKLVNT